MSAADRSLLCGFLALRMDFISPEQLAAALTARGTQPQKMPPGEILRRNGALSDRQLQALELLVDLHIERHGGDTARGLAALRIDPPPLPQEPNHIIPEAEI